MSLSHAGALRTGPHRRHRTSWLARVMNFVIPRLQALDRRMSRPAAVAGRSWLQRAAADCESSLPGQAAEFRALASRAVTDRR